MTPLAGIHSDSDDSTARRDRLALLKARRQSLVEPSTEHSFSKAQPTTKDWVASDTDAAKAAVPKPDAAPVKANMLVDLMSGKLQAGKAARAQIMAKAMQMLTRTPLDADGIIAGTPFSSAGLTLLMQMLRSRATTENTPGGKSMQAVVNFLQADPGEAATPQGLSLSKLQMIAQRIGGGAGQGAPMAAPAPAAQDGATRSAHRQMMGKLHYMLTNTPADARGMVTGTSYSAAGVTRLMALLRQRATQPGTQAGRLSLRLLEALAAAKGEAEVIDGASLPKLRTLAGRLSRAASSRPRKSGAAGWSGIASFPANG